MIDIKTIVDEYQKGDAEKRLNLFLEYAPLRDEFIQIEQGQVSTPNAGVWPSAIKQSGKRKSVFYPCTRLLKRCQALIG